MRRASSLGPTKTAVWSWIPFGAKVQKQVLSPRKHHVGQPAHVSPRMGEERGSMGRRLVCIIVSAMLVTER